MPYVKGGAKTRPEDVIVFAAIVEDIRPINTKKGEMMLFVRLADFTGSIEAVVFPRVYQELKAIFLPDACLAIKGKISERNGEKKRHHRQCEAPRVAKTAHFSYFSKNARVYASLFKNMSNQTPHEKLSHARHTLAHLLAAAVGQLYPGTKNTIGPAIDDGFYYDFEFPADVKLSEKELPALEKKMKSILKHWQRFEHKEVSEAEASELFKDNPYKLELIKEIAAKGEKITLYTAGSGSSNSDAKAASFTDLCRGGHSDNPSKDIAPDSFKLSRLAGAYWRGSEENTMLTPRLRPRI